MPIYEYQCNDCGHTFDVLQKISDEPLHKCPNCGKKALSKLISPAGFRLKGTGWYETDFKSSNKKNVAAEAAGKQSEPKKTDDKPKSDKKASGDAA